MTERSDGVLRCAQNDDPFETGFFAALGMTEGSDGVLRYAQNDRAVSLCVGWVSAAQPTNTFFPVGYVRRGGLHPPY